MRESKEAQGPELSLLRETRPFGTEEEIDEESSSERSWKLTLIQKVLCQCRVTAQDEMGEDTTFFKLSNSFRNELG